MVIVERSRRRKHDDATRKTVNVVVTRAFRDVQTQSASKDDISHLQQSMFALHHLARRIVECGEFVLAIVNEQPGLQFGPTNGNAIGGCSQTVER